MFPAITVVIIKVKIGRIIIVEVCEEVLIHFCPKTSSKTLKDRLIKIIINTFTMPRTIGFKILYK